VSGFYEDPFQAKQHHVVCSGCGELADALDKSGRDPREDLAGPILRNDVLKIEDLEPGGS
jgi:transcriptional accessory protein Tex/SPT6